MLTRELFTVRALPRAFNLGIFNSESIEESVEPADSMKDLENSQT